MVTPYLSRLRPAGPGPRLRPRPWSTFEPAPALPIDGPATGSPGVGWPTAWDAQTAGPETELDQDPPDRHPGAPLAAAAPGGQGLPPVRTAAPGPTARAHERTPAAAADGPPPWSPAPATPLGQGRGGWSGAPGPTAREQERTPAPAADGPWPERTPDPATAPAGGHGRAASAGDEEGSWPAAAAAAGREHVLAPWTAARRAGPQARHAPPDQAPVPGDRADPGDRAGPGNRPGAAPPERPSPERPPLAPRGPADRTSQQADAPAGDAADDVPAVRVQAMARWLRDAGAAAPHAEATTSPSSSPQPPPPPGRVPGWPRPAAQPDVTVTIGRIEVKAPAPEPAPMPPGPNRQRRQAPSLEDYLESRARVRGRPG